MVVYVSMLAIKNRGLPLSCFGLQGVDLHVEKHFFSNERLALELNESLYLRSL